MRPSLSKYRLRLYETVSLVGEALKVGERTRQIPCPACGGGDTKEKSFSISKEEGVLYYKCWRSSCLLKPGAIENTTGSLIQEPKPIEFKESSKKESRPYTGILQILPKEGYDIFRDKYGLEEPDLAEGEVLWAETSDRYSFPVHSPNWERRGTSLRLFHNRASYPKWDHYPARTDCPWIGWYIRPSVSYRGGPIVLVEDPISALKVSRHFVCCYLNGTSLGLDALMEVIKYARFANAVLALDKDATAKAAEIIHKHRFFLGNKAFAVPVEKDPKYLDDEEIKTLFSPYSLQSRK